MWPSRRDLFKSLDNKLYLFSKIKIKLPGTENPESRKTLSLQMVASLRRLDYTKIICERPIDPLRTDPNNTMFDPERAAIFYRKNNNINEACWLIFLATHFGKHPIHGWERVRNVYSGLGSNIWSWERISRDPDAFQRWLRQNEKNIGGGFGNHRKYESLNADSHQGTASVIRSYIEWVGDSHMKLISKLVRKGGNDPHKIFDEFYNSMNVNRFGRLGKFDFLTLLGRLDLAPIKPGKAYLQGATGPLRGARLLFKGDSNSDISAQDLERMICELDSYISIGMQAMEDSLCNWQKSPRRFIHFRG